MWFLKQYENIKCCILVIHCIMLGYSKAANMNSLPFTAKLGTFWVSHQALDQTSDMISQAPPLSKSLLRLPTEVQNRKTCQGQNLCQNSKTADRWLEKTWARVRLYFIFNLVSNVVCFSYRKASCEHLTPSEQEGKQNICFQERLRLFLTFKDKCTLLLTNACPDILCAYLDELLLWGSAVTEYFL